MQKHNQWLALVQGDLYAAKILLTSNDIALPAAAYHCQQAAEKSLKGYLEYKDISIQKTHDLVALVNMCNLLDNDFIRLRPVVMSLNPYSTRNRYPDDFFAMLDASSVLMSLQEAQAVLDFVQQKVV